MQDHMVYSRSVDRLSWSCLIWHPTILGGFITLLLQMGLPCVSDSKESACSEDPGSIPGLRTFPGEENGYLLQYSFFFFICSEFCHTLKWNSHGFTCVPHPDPPSYLPLHPLPLGLPSAPGLSPCLMHPTWAGDLFAWRRIPWTEEPGRLQSM